MLRTARCSRVREMIHFCWLLLLMCHQLITPSLVLSLFIISNLRLMSTLKRIRSDMWKCKIPALNAWKMYHNETAQQYHNVMQYYVKVPFQVAGVPPILSRNNVTVSLVGWFYWNKSGIQNQNRSECHSSVLCLTTGPWPVPKHKN
jgi:hypothetical protein